MIDAEFAQLLPGIVGVVDADPHIDALYLYGSHAKGSANAHSDIDLAVIFSSRESDPLQQRLRSEWLAMEWNQKFNLPENTISVLDLEIAPIPIAMAVLKTGKLLVNKNPGHDFEVSGKIMSKWEIDYLYHHRHFG
jgi:uncharacterized protein